MTTYDSDPEDTATETGHVGTDTGPDTSTAHSTGLSSTSPDADTGTQEKAAATASAAVDEGKHVAGTAKDEALNIAGTAAEQARSVMGEARQQVTTQLSDQATTQRDNLSQTLHTFGDDLQQMVDQGPAGGMASDLVREISDRARALGSHLEGREPAQLLDDARSFARRRPGAFLLGALAAGVVAGRVFRATADGAAAASLAETGDAGTINTSASTGTGTVAAGASTGVGIAPETGHTAPTPSLDDHPGTGYGTGYGTGPDGTGGLDDTFNPAVGTDTSSTAAVSPSTTSMPGQPTQGTL